MNKANECTCPSGDGSLRWPCPKHPAVEQAGGDERAAFKTAYLAEFDCDADGDDNMAHSNTAWRAWKMARAALAQPSLAQAEAERPELWAVHAQGPDELYAAFSREDAEKHAAELNALPMPEGIAVGAVVVPSPWPAVQHWQYLAEQEQDHKNEIAGRLRQLERICEGLPQDAIDGGWTVQGIRGYAKCLEDQLKAALARVAELDQALAEKDPFGAKLNRISEKLERCDALLAARAAQAGQVPQAWIDVQAERRRQVEAEGWTPEHDDEHACDEIAAFACFYAMPPAARDWDTSSTGYGDTLGEAILPEGWEPKTGDRRRELVKAGGLILAEIERLDRAAPGKEVGHE